MSPIHVMEPIQSDSVATTTAVFVFWDDAATLARDEAAVAVTEAEEDADGERIVWAMLLAADWESVLLEEHVVEMHHLGHQEGLLLGGEPLASLAQFKIVGVGRRADRSAELAAVRRL